MKRNLLALTVIALLVALAAPAMGVLPPDPVGDLAPGPSDTWRPGSAHLRQIDTMGRWLESVGIPKHKAQVWAFELWKLNQKASYHG